MSFLDNPAWLARILTIGAVLEIGTGAGLLVAPSKLAVLLLRSPLEGAGRVIGRVAGGALLALGLACWYARLEPATTAGLGVARAFFVYNLVVCITLAAQRPAIGRGGLPALSGAVLHGLLAVALLIALL